MIENTPVGASSEDPAEGAVDLKVMRITSENLTTSEGLGAMETIPGETSDGADQEGGASEFSHVGYCCNIVLLGMFCDFVNFCLTCAGFMSG
jgi:hypothetical protein